MLYGLYQTTEWHLESRQRGVEKGERENIDSKAGRAERIFYSRRRLIENDIICGTFDTAINCDLLENYQIAY